MQEQAQKTKIRYIDYFKALAMILVILGHINFVNAGLRAWIYAFHMPAFFFSSGMLMKDGTALGLRAGAETLWKRFQSLMFPYFIWALIYSPLEISNLIRILYGSHQTLSSAGSLTSLWFLPTLFVATAMFLLARITLKQKLTVPVKLILASVSFCIAAFLPKIRYGYPWGVNLAFSAFGFLLLGNVLFPLIRRFSKAAAGKKGVPLCAALVLSTAAASLLYRLNVPDSGYINMANAVYGNYLLFLLSAMIGIALLLSVSVLIDRLLPVGKRDPLAFVGQNTMCVFAAHKAGIKAFVKLFEIIRVPSALALAVTCVGTAVVCCPIAVFLNRYLPTMVGRIPKREP